MRITALETIQLGEFPNLCFVRLHTDAGLVGLGETFFGAHEVAAYLHETAAVRLLGKDPSAIDGLRVALPQYVGTRSTGTEARGNSAMDIALWDLAGKATGQPVVQLLGGATRQAIRVYNTCAGYRYVRANKGQMLRQLGPAGGGARRGSLRGPRRLPPRARGRAGPESSRAGRDRHEDVAVRRVRVRLGGHEHHGGRARQGTRALPPGAPDGRRADGHDGRAPRALESADGPEDRAGIRVGGLHPYWIEDPLRPDDIASLARFAHGTTLPTTASEMLGGRQSFRELLEARAASIVMLDLGWCGGLTEGKAIASMAEAFGLPVAPHDCTGPVVWMASVHLSLNAPNALIQETVRAFFTGWYTELVSGLPVVENGTVRLGASRPGLGVELLPGLTARPDATVRRSEAT